MTAPGEGIFLDLRAGGLTAEGIAGLFPPPLYFTAALDGGAVSDKAALMTALAAAFRFPAYFGRNWDALLDCLRSLPEFNPAGGYALLIRDSGRFLAASPKDKEDFLDVASEAGQFLSEKLKLPFKVVFL
ncbi:MAG: barstar family protein [Elusimicrobiales bacterium]|nr:barstar family protein [Elusimicrobiales bacterium]